MKNTIIMIPLLVLGASLFAAEAEKQDFKKMTPEERRARIYKATGGFVIQPGSQKGRIAVFNAQKRVSTQELAVSTKKLSDSFGFNLTVEDAAPVTVATAAKAKSDANAGVAVFLVDDPALPTSLVAYEDHWAILNVSKLAEGADKVQLFGRVSAETMRVIALATGGADSQFPDTLMRHVKKPSDLDGVNAALPLDVMNRMILACKDLGITARRRVAYRVACKEGWAAAPTNDVQKAVWDQVHEIPSEPIKIKYDPKRDKAN